MNELDELKVALKNLTKRVHRYEKDEFITISINTTIEVRNTEHEKWIKRHLAVYIPEGTRGKFWCFNNNDTQTTAKGVTGWNYGRRVED